jgi:ubiquinone/menaquinone biosynthesis C-methylase UbiE
MLSPNLYRKSKAYDFFMRSLGYERSLGRFLSQIHLDQGQVAQILDAGCGTGLLGLGLLRRFPNAQLLATDLEPNFLKQTLINAERRGIAKEKIQVGVSNISQPKLLQTLDNRSLTIADGSVQLICTGGVIGYSSNIERTLRQLVDLLSIGGSIINLEMNESLAARFVSHRYRYRNIPLARMVHVLREAGCNVTQRNLGLAYLPAKFTRTAIVATKI